MITPIKNFTSKSPIRKFLFLLTCLLFLTFLGLYIFQQNTEFILYLSSMTLFILFVFITDYKINYPDSILIGLIIWAFLHMSGGGIVVNNAVLYHYMIIPISENLIRYDQLVHMFGSIVITFFMSHVFTRYLLPDIHKSPNVLALILIFSAIGMGSINENIEFFMTIILPQTNVGGYINTSFDLLFNLMGALIGALYLRKNKYHIA